MPRKPKYVHYMPNTDYCLKPDDRQVSPTNTTVKQKGKKTLASTLWPVKRYRSCDFFTPTCTSTSHCRHRDAPSIPQKKKAATQAIVLSMVHVKWGPTFGSE
jgi:hypothetical protein